jgi:ABC-type oligopeptide transport system ATPase subunit
MALVRAEALTKVYNTAGVPVAAVNGVTFSMNETPSSSVMPDRSA